jgi:ParB-like chromosome segregation protein Spo0J
MTIRSLAEEIRAEGFWNGTLQGRRNASGQIELVFGHRRLRALRLLKLASARIEILDLTDAQMALRSLEENLQREGLNEFEKADAVKTAVDIEKATRRDRGESERGALQVVADRLGLAQPWVSKLCEISISLDMKDRISVGKSGISAKTAAAAKDWGGKEYLNTLTKQAKQAQTNEKISKPTEHTVAAMKRLVASTPDAVQEQLKAEIVAGKVTPDKAESRARRLASLQVKREKEPPPDLRVVIVGWTRDLEDWKKRMKDVVPYMDYVDEVPAIANRFRDALSELIDTAKELLKSAR